MTNETTELDVYRPHLAELGRQKKGSAIFGQCSVDMKEEWFRGIDAIIEEMERLHRSGDIRPRDSLPRLRQYRRSMGDTEQ